MVVTKTKARDEDMNGRVQKDVWQCVSVHFTGIKIEFSFYSR